MIKNLLKNKRGDIPITILVIGVLAICALAIFTFYTSSRNFKNGFDSIDIIEKISIEKEKISLYEKDLGFTQEEAKEIFNIKEDIQGRYITAQKETISVRYNLPK
ncbi:MAG TPA: hypothetical protein VMV95_04105 [Bacillota bacterium]|nr:hypothetical protein [Bacillota bacterium]